MRISFGSDGFRGVIGAEFTRDAVERIAQASARFCSAGSSAGPPKAVLGFDTRFLSREMADVCAATLQRAGVEALRLDRPCPSPYLAFATHHLQAQLGLQITASHNPYFYNGVKIKGSFGGSMLAADVATIQDWANAGSGSPAGRLQHSPDTRTTQLPGLDGAYGQAILAAARVEGPLDIPVIVDYMHGTGSGIYRDVLQRVVGVRQELRVAADPLFGGSKPEPLEENLAELKDRVLDYAGSGVIGLAFDGDGDRLAVIDETGRYLAAHEIFCLLLEHLAPEARPGTVVVTTVSFSGLVNRVAEAQGLLVYEVPVGFKNVTEAMLHFDALLGGEESGGAGIGRHLPERDALLMALLLLQHKAQRGCSLHELVEEIYVRHGRPVFVRRDMPLPLGTDMEAVKLRIRELAALSSLAGESIDSLNHRDGMKIRTAEGWVLVRASGTEPLLRIYAEADKKATAEAYIAEVSARFPEAG